MKKYLLFTEINPVPWKAPTASSRRGKGGGRYAQMSSPPEMKVYKEAIATVLDESYPEMEPWPKRTPVYIEFYYWRRLDQHQGPSGRMVTAKRCDVTNLNKNLEDALEGFLYHDDVDNKRVTGTMVSQSRITDPMILVIASDEILPGHIQDIELDRIVNQLLLEPAPFHSLVRYLEAETL